MIRYRKHIRHKEMIEILVTNVRGQAELESFAAELWSRLEHQDPIDSRQCIVS